MATPQKHKDPAKGCKVCDRRRIRCDLERPFCQKCQKKGLKCPGYGPQLKWIGGVAARGRLKGLNTPGYQGVSPGKSQASTRPLVLPTADLESAGYSPHRLDLLTADADFHSFTSGLLEYYSKSIAGLMVWLDTDQNDYRRRVLPLAKNEPGLRLAVAAISAQHGSALFPHSPPEFPELARDACLGFIQRSAEEMTHRLTTGSVLDSCTDLVTAEWMLASILIMICFEMVQSRLEAAECHLKAARRLINIFSSTNAGTSELFGFLQNQLSIHDVLASTTSFNLQDLENTITPPPNTKMTIFSEYLTLLHRVTLTSRQAACRSDTDSSTLPQQLSANFVRSQFEQARGATLLTAGKLHLEHSTPRHDLVHLVETYHNAALLYSYRCVGLEKLDPATRLEQQLLSLRLPDQLLQFDDQKLHLQNLPWPALIAGTECHGNVDQQGKVVKVFLDIYESTKFKHYLEILEFLQTFWNGTQTDWRILAQDWEAAGRRILAV
ncbi:Zn(2)-C6 fungal-type DNA-binding domain protein [Ilyonectria robusta]